MEAVSDIIKYGCAWPEGTEPLKIEIACIQSGGKWKMGNRECGMGLSYHFEQMRRIIWPELDTHRWHDLTRDAMANNQISVFIGPASSAKTHSAAWFYLCDWWCFPEETCLLCSSTDMRGLRQRVWGEISSLWQKGVDRFPWLAGHLLDSRLAITNDELEDGDFEERRVRDMRKAMCGVPCKSGNTWVGLAAYQGIKQKRMRLIADEASAMASSFLSAFANLNKNPDFKATILGNPNDPLDPLGVAAEPEDGWDGHMEPEKTSTWRTRFMNGFCVNLVGTDSPNFDFPQDQKPRFPYLISKKSIDLVLTHYSKDDYEYYSQCVGVMKVSMLSRRIITREMCRRFGALEDVAWAGSPITKVAGLDAAYGGDRAVCGYVEFGKDVNGIEVINFHPPVIVPFNLRSTALPEEQLAEFCKKYCEDNGVPAANFFHDSTGRGTLGTFLSRIWSADTNPVEFGGKPSERPVSLTHFIYDPKTRVKRLQKCSEYYDRFVSELWYSMRHAIEAGQVRNFPQNVMDEAATREFKRGAGDKVIIETKQELKERIGFSCDLADWAAICLEGCRRLGFQIKKLSNESDNEFSKQQWLRDAAFQAKAIWKSGELVST